MGFQSSFLLLSEYILFLAWLYFLCRKGNLFGIAQPYRALHELQRGHLPNGEPPPGDSVS